MSEPTLNFHIQTRLIQFKIPTELIKKNFKNVQKQIEKQRKQVSDDVTKIKKNQKLPTAMKLEMVRKIIKNFESFQRKLQNNIKKDEELRSRLMARLENLTLLAQFTIDKKEESNEEGSKSVSDGGDRLLDLHNVNLINWYRDQTNLLIVDYLLKSNTYSGTNIGNKLLRSFQQTNLLKLIDYDLLENFNKVFVSIIEHHDLSLVVAWFNENRNALKKVNSNLEFEINYCEFLSLINKGQVNEAIYFSREKLSPYGNKGNYSDGDYEKHEKNLNKLKEIGGLLVYMSINEGVNPKNGNGSTLFSSAVMANTPRFHEYKRLLSNERWESLSKCFIENFNKIYGISKTYPLFVYLSAGLSSLKTKSCYCNSENTIFHNDDYENNVDSKEDIYKKDLAVLTDKKFRGPNQYYRLLNKINNCPVCSPELFTLSKNLPYAQLITHIFEKPYKLPNGNIYPFDKLLKPSEKHLSEKNTLLRMKKIKDPLTREIFMIEDCIRVYPA